MKRYNVNVNGKMYQVEVEEVGGFSAPMAAPAPIAQAAPAPVAQTPVAQPAPAAEAAPAPTSSGPVAGAMSAPMPGTILDIKVSEGQSVKTGDVLVVLEAMKMENEIVAPSDGKVIKIYTSKGSAVSSGDALLTIG